MITDHAYQLPTKPSLEDALERELSRARRHQRPLTVGLLGVDRLWAVESAYGARGVLKLLETLQERGGRLVRGEDLFGHWQGALFLLAMPETTLRGAISGLNRVKMQLERYHTRAGCLKLNVGVAALATGDDTFTVVAKADAMLRWQQACEQDCTWKGLTTLWQAELESVAPALDLGLALVQGD